MKKKEQSAENYLERVPVHKQGLKWSVDDKGIVTLCIPNTGLFNRIAQKLLKKPPVTYIHLDENGSFVWPIIDGKKDIIKIGELVKERFGEEAEPLYPRLAKFFQILESYGFVEWK
ncbi:MAG: PqqD family protein [Clostridia bacterium]|nr:PqqD family protein [Clostridia bacterium]